MSNTAFREEDSPPTCAALVIEKILVVVDPTADVHPCIDKAASIAASVGASIELFICDAEPTPVEGPSGVARIAEYREQRRLGLLDKLDDLAEPLRARGISTTTAHNWRAPIETGISEHAIRTKPDLVVKDTHRHSPLTRGPVIRTDWTLISQLPAPLLLVRPNPWPEKLKVAVATDPCHDSYRPTALDECLVSTACLLANSTRGTAIALHVLQTPPHLPGDSVSSIDRARAHGCARDAVEKLVLRADNQRTPMPVHYIEGNVASSVIAFVTQQRPDVVVAGVSARGRWLGSAAGGTAARVLEDVECDLLLIKPRGFVSPLLVTDEV